MGTQFKCMDWNRRGVEMDCMFRCKMAERERDIRITSSLIQPMLSLTLVEGGGSCFNCALTEILRPYILMKAYNQLTENCVAEQNQKRKIETSNTVRNRGAAKARDYQLGSMDRMILLLHTCR